MAIKYLNKPNTKKNSLNFLFELFVKNILLTINKFIMDFIKELIEYYKEIGFKPHTVFELKKDLPNKTKGTLVFLYDGGYQTEFWSKHMKEGQVVPQIGWYYLPESSKNFLEPCPFSVDVHPKWFEPYKP